MLDEKDKIILEHLMSNCRITTTKLAKLTKLSQPSIVYRIKKLEKEGYILKYDILINTNNFNNSNMYFIFFSIPNKQKKVFEQICKEDTKIMTVTKQINKYNYSITTILTDKELASLTRLFENHNFIYFVEKGEENRSFVASAFDINIREEKKELKHEYLKLDEKDARILSRLHNGGGKDSILELAKFTKLPIDLTLYRFKKLEKAGYFELCIAQANLNKFHLQYDVIRFEVNDITSKEIFNLFRKNKKAIFASFLGNNKYLVTIVSKNFKDYKNTLSTIFNELDEKLIFLEEYMIEEIVKLNQIDFKRIIKNENN